MQAINALVWHYIRPRKHDLNEFNRLDGVPAPKNPKILTFMLKMG